MEQLAYVFHHLRNLPTCAKRPDLAGYMLVVALIAVMMIGAISFIGAEVKDFFVNSVLVIGQTAGPGLDFNG